MRMCDDDYLSTISKLEDALSRMRSLSLTHSVPHTLSLRLLLHTRMCDDDDLSTISPGVRVYVE